MKQRNIFHNEFLYFTNFYSCFDVQMSYLAAFVSFSLDSAILRTCTVCGSLCTDAHECVAHHFSPFLIVGIRTRSGIGLNVWMQTVDAYLRMELFTLRAKWQTPLKRRTSNEFAIYQTCKNESPRENNETDRRFIVGHNKICWNKINFIESNARCIPNDLTRCRW